MTADRALILVDIQNDFMPDGALPVAQGDSVVPIANRLAQKFDFVVASQDWHPRDHVSFASNHPGCSPGDITLVDGQEQVLWPDHCVQGTCGASFHSALDVTRICEVVHKGSDPAIDSYSTFFDNEHRRDTGLFDILGARGITEVVFVGLATDYCVLWSALDARMVGLGVTVILDGVRGVELTEGDSDRALQKMKDHECRLMSSAQMLSMLDG